MIPFILLIAVTTIVLLSLKIARGSFELARSARIGMSVMLLFTAMGHFMFPEGMSLMIPDFIPLKKELVYITAILEMAAAFGLQIRSLRTPTAWLLIVFFILVLPANIKAAMEHLDYQKATFDGKGPVYLWFRIPLQLLFIAWVYFSSIRFKPQTSVEKSE